MKRERQCTVTGQKITPDQSWISVDMFTGSIIECEDYIATQEWHLQGYKNIKVVSAETPTPTTIRNQSNDQEEQQPPVYCAICED